MSQQLVTSPVVIYDTLTGDTEFMTRVGEYTFNNGGTLDSISILTPGESVPSLSNVTGVEVIIHDIGSINKINYISEASDGVAIWNVYLIAWPPAKGDDLMLSAKRMVKLFSNASVISVSSRSGGTGTSLGALDQILVTIPELSVVNA